VKQGKEMTLDMVCAFRKEELIKIKQSQSSGKTL
jgi:hypothetical protein